MPAARVVVDGRRVRRDTKTHQDRYLAIDPVTCAMIREHLDVVRARLADVGVELHEDAYLFSNDPAGATPWNPDWASHKAHDLAAAAGVKLNIKGLRHYTASQLLAARFDLRNTAARLGHGSGGATTLRHYADPVSEVDRRAAAYLAQLTAGSASDALRGASSRSAQGRPDSANRCTDGTCCAGTIRPSFHESPTPTMIRLRTN